MRRPARDTFPGRLATRVSRARASRNDEDISPRDECARAGSPYDTRFADGTAIDDDLLAQIRAAWWDNSVACTLRDGDLVVVDNLLVGHGRMGWRPDIERKMLLSHFD